MFPWPTWTEQLEYEPDPRAMPVISRHQLPSGTYRIRRPFEDSLVVAKRKISPSDLSRNGRQFVHSVSLGETLARGGKCGNQTLPKSIKNPCCTSRHTSPNTMDL
ncbi:hypothetical protein Pcinc_022686 [Petrolisthes cinctipes]|uniref:Uncharacterized protein n=1 Tax=Petrolisthes cinctipes TaxID=88211 RepID=A0AAE1FDR8_PETCI|nr:hypothetical protein Pcinc_022686 [Petrolisthes cinctipes]